jgi:hypothetical protein
MEMQVKLISLYVIYIVNPNILKILSNSYCWNKIFMKLDDTSKI